MKTMNNFKQITQLITLCIPSIFIAQESYLINSSLLDADVRRVDENILITTTHEQNIVQLSGSFELHNTKGSAINKITIRPLEEGHKIYLLYNDSDSNIRKKGGEERYRSRIWACREEDQDVGFKRPEEKTGAKITTFPNPVTNQLQVTSKDIKIIGYQLLDATNRVLKQQTIASTTLVIDVTDIDSGTYYLKISLENQTQEIKPIIKN